MRSSMPRDVVVFDLDTLSWVRVDLSGRGASIASARSFRLPYGTFAQGSVSPSVTDPGGITETLRRLKMEAGRLDKVSLLLPDSWFRLNLLDLSPLPDRAQERDEMVRWSLKRTLPVPAEQVRLRYQVLERDGNAAKVLVVAALEETLRRLETLFTEAGIDVVMIEPVALNIWNAISAGLPEEPASDRLFIYVRPNEFTTAVFHGSTPRFIRSRNLSGDRSVTQEMRLSASYLKSNVNLAAVESCIVAGNELDPALIDAIREDFGAPVQRVSMREQGIATPADAHHLDAEMTASTGVFAL